MAWEMKIVGILLVANYMQYVVNGAEQNPQVPCFFIFGDSMVDNGNNNPLPTLAKVNYHPYGIDNVHGPTGRFSNGRTPADVLGQLLGFDEFIPPFTTATGSEILKGVNYASGSAGIRGESGQQLGERLSLDRQLDNHQTTVSNIVIMLGSEKLATNHLRQCLYYVGMGSNDYINNYFKPQIYPTSLLYTPEQYAEVLIQQYHNHIKRLYNNGARKVALIGLGLIGCTPFAISNYDTKGSVCVDDMNIAAHHFNQKLISLVDHFNSNLTDAKFIYVDSFGIGLSGGPSGLTVSNVGCCPTDNNGHCIANQTSICEDRSSYVFWDSFHTTEVVNEYTAKRMYTHLLPSDTYPIDISQLVQLQLESSEPSKPFIKSLMQFFRANFVSILLGNSYGIWCLLLKAKGMVRSFLTKPKNS
ncbi:hypothetical protein UlMin_018766 [Ulmus minor]